jgi:DNA-binding Lrp family transcriptional regulator
LQGNGDEIETLLNRFKEMEKERIIKACDAGFDSAHLFIEDMKYKSPEDYYEQTYGGNK